MNRQIRRLGLAMVLCYLVVFAQLNVVQVFRADEYNTHPANTRAVQREFNRDRGLIVTADDVVLAETVEVEGDTFDRERRYPEGDLFGHVTGYFSFLFGASGVERTYGSELAGDTFEQQLRGWRDLFVEQSNIGDVHLTMRADLQELARDALGDQEGAIVALDPRTGGVLSMWSNPSYDPNLLSTIDLAASQEAWDDLRAAPDNPMLSRSFQDRYFPGSTFKVVTGGVGLRDEVVSADNPSYPTETSWTPPLTNLAIGNFGGSSCGGALIQVMRVSCNTAFARMGVETIGPDAMVEGVESWGFNSTLPLDLPDPATSAFPTDFTEDLPRLAQASIGQNDVEATPLQMALVAAAVANGGEMVVPHVVREVTDRNGAVVSEHGTEIWRTPLTAEKNETLHEAMLAVVEDGTGTVLQTPGMEVGAKTGTAQLGTDPPRQHAWMIAFAGPPGDPEVALAVVALNQTGDATGGGVAGPIARQMLDGILALESNDADADDDDGADDPPADADQSPVTQ